MKIQSGYSYYGQDIGILVNASTSPRVPGDAGHSGSFSYQVRYQITGTSFVDMIEGSEETRAKLIRAAQALKDAGCRGIVGDCGLMSLYQKDVAREVGLPFVSASLIQLPIVWEMIGRSGKIGIVTGHSDFLKETHLRGCGWNPEIDIAIEGMQGRAHFSEIVIRGGYDLHPEKMSEEVVDACLTLQAREKDLKAIILECSNLATYSRAAAEATGLPVFDTLSAADLLRHAICPPVFETR